MIFEIGPGSVVMAVSAVAGASVGLIAWFTRREVERTEKRLDALELGAGNMKVEVSSFQAELRSLKDTTDRIETMVSDLYQRAERRGRIQITQSRRRRR